MGVVHSQPVRPEEETRCRATFDPKSSDLTVARVEDYLNANANSGRDSGQRAGCHAVEDTEQSESALRGARKSRKKMQTAREGAEKL